MNEKTKKIDALDDGLVVDKPNLNAVKDSDKLAKVDQALQKELNGPKGLEPTRYGDWEAKGRCYDF